MDDNPAMDDGLRKFRLVTDPDDDEGDDDPFGDDAGDLPIPIGQADDRDALRCPHCGELVIVAVQLLPVYRPGGAA